MNRLIPYKGYAYERDLIEYAGSVINDALHTPQILSYVTPGLSVVRLGAGTYRINLKDKVPISSQIVGQDAVPADLSCIDKGFASSCMIWANARDDADPASTNIKIAYSVPQLAGPAELFFTLVTHVANVATDISFSFRIYVTGQPAKFVQGLGA